MSLIKSMNLSTIYIRIVVIYNCHKKIKILNVKQEQ